jgi:hypothetical protein
MGNYQFNVSLFPTGVSPTENSWKLRPYYKESLGYCAPDQTILKNTLRKRHRIFPQRSKGIARSYNVWVELAPDGGAQTYRKGKEREATGGQGVAKRN